MDTETFVGVIIPYIEQQSGVSVKEWRGQRWYLRLDGKDAGYLVEGLDPRDVASHITRRKSTVKQWVREAVAEAGLVDELPACERP